MYAVSLSVMTNCENFLLSSTSWGLFADARQEITAFGDRRRKKTMCEILCSRF